MNRELDFSDRERPQVSDDAGTDRPIERTNPSRLEVELLEAEKAALAHPGDEGIAFRAAAVRIRGEMAYAQARERAAVSVEGEESKKRTTLSIKVSESFFLRLARVTAMEEEDLPSFMRRALLHEMDRMEREQMVERRDEGQPGLKSFQGKKRRLRARRGT
jgi:hypothetical protein